MRHPMAASAVATLLFLAPLAAAAQDAPPATDGAEALISQAVEAAERDQAVEALARAEDAFFAIWDRLPLDFRQIELVRGEPEGYGQIEPRADNVFAPGEEITVYVDPIGFGWREGENGWETDLAADFVLSTPEGRIIAGQKDFGEFRIRSPRRARESFLVVNYEFSGVPDGDYVLTTTVKDRIDEETASFELPITISEEGGASGTLR